MNAASSSPTDFVEDNNAGDNSDSDANETILDNYEPITTNAEDSDDEDSNEANLSEYHIIDSRGQHHILPNGFINPQPVVNGVRSIDISDDNDDQDSEREKEEEDERRRAELDIQRAFQADESRRATPLGEDNAARVREAMRGVAFHGFEPEWARSVPEDQWIDRLRNLRHSPSATPRSAA